MLRTWDITRINGTQTKGKIMSKEAGKVLVRQTRSVAGSTKRVRATLDALGLGRIGKQKEHALNPCVTGMLKKVRHLVSITEAK